MASSGITASHSFRVSNGSIPYESFVKIMPRLLYQMRRFLLQAGVISVGECDELCVKVEKELVGEDFCGMALVARVWGRCW